MGPVVEEERAVPIVPLALMGTACRIQGGGGLGPVRTPGIGPPSAARNARLITLRTSGLPTIRAPETAVHQVVGLAEMLIPIWPITSPAGMVGKCPGLVIGTYMVVRIIKTTSVPTVLACETEMTRVRPCSAVKTPLVTSISARLLLKGKTMTAIGLSPIIAPKDAILVSSLLTGPVATEILVTRIAFGITAVWVLTAGACTNTDTCPPTPAVVLGVVPIQPTPIGTQDGLKGVSYAGTRVTATRLLNTGTRA